MSKRSLGKSVFQQQNDFIIKSLLEKLNLQLLYDVSVDLSQVCHAHGTPLCSLTVEAADA